MKFLKRLSAVLLAMVFSCCMCAVSVSAGSIEETAVSIQAGKTYSGKIQNGSVDNYKIKVNAKGEMKLSFTSYIKNTFIFVYDSDFAQQEPEVSLTSGKWFSNYSIDYDKNTEVAKGTETFAVKPGTYYIQIKGQYTTNSGKYKFSVSVPGESSNTTVSNSSGATIKLCMEVGDKIDLSAMSGGKDVSSAKWSSSNDKVAKVSTKGKITAMKAGSCTITWKSGSTSFTVYVEVE
ncbi:MAG: Ig-like domain-containing protein [Oscillospiraceae bacterium]